MKKIFSSLLLLLLFPYRLIRKGKDNFLMGLIFGAIFSLLVNVISIKLQGRIERQRILEAIENEILSNELQARISIDANNKRITEDGDPEYYHYVMPYSRDLWEQSTEPLQYVAQLDPEIQKDIVIYYTATIRNSNALLQKINSITNDYLIKCYLDIIKLSNEDKVFCKFRYQELLKTENLAAEWIEKGSFDLLHKFHPTKDRLNSIILRIFMGSKSLKPLS